jgi:hypothetical protein
MQQASSLSATTSRPVITYRPLSELIPDPGNARTHPKRQIEQIQTSIASSRTPPRWSLIRKIDSLYRKDHMLISRATTRRLELAADP